LLCLICQDGMWCISLAPDAWNLSRHCQATQDAQDAGDATQDAQEAGDAKDATQDAQDALDAMPPYLTQDNLLLMQPQFHRHYGEDYNP